MGESASISCQGLLGRLFPTYFPRRTSKNWNWKSHFQLVPPALAKVQIVNRESSRFSCRRGCPELPVQCSSGFQRPCCPEEKSHTCGRLRLLVSCRCTSKSCFGAEASPDATPRVHRGQAEAEFFQLSSCGTNEWIGRLAETGEDWQRLVTGPGHSRAGCRHFPGNQGLVGNQWPEKSHCLDDHSPQNGVVWL